MKRQLVFAALLALLASPAPAATAYTISRDLSLFDYSSMTQGNGDTLGMVAVACDNWTNWHATTASSSGTVLDLGDLFDGNPIEINYPCDHVNLPVAINASGSVVGASSYLNGPGLDSANPHYWVWRPATGMQEIAIGVGHVLSINDADAVVGRANPGFGIGNGCVSDPAVENLAGFIWTPEDGLHNLNGMITNFDGFDCIYDATAINNRGQIIAEAVEREPSGLGVLNQVVLIPTPVPAVGWLLGSAFGVLGWCRRMRAR